MNVEVKISVALQWTDLPELVVDHHVVGLHVPMHDAHTVTVVQSLSGTVVIKLILSDQQTSVSSLEYN